MNNLHKSSKTIQSHFHSTENLLQIYILITWKCSWAYNAVLMAKANPYCKKHISFWRRCYKHRVTCKMNQCPHARRPTWHWNFEICLPHFWPMFDFISAKTTDNQRFLVFSGGKKLEHWLEIGLCHVAVSFKFKFTHFWLNFFFLPLFSWCFQCV